MASCKPGITWRSTHAQTLLTRVCPFVRLQVRALGIYFVAAHHVTPVNFAPSQTVAIVGCSAGGSGPTAHTVLRSNPITGIHYRRFVEDPETLGETPHFMKLIDARIKKYIKKYINIYLKICF